MVSPRLTIFISGQTSWLTETWVKPISRAILRDLRFVRGVAIAVQQHDGDDPIAGIERRLQSGARGLLIELGQHLALRRHALVDLQHR